VNADEPALPEENLEPWLAALDRVIDTEETPADENAADKPAEVLPRVEQVRECLRLLDRIWPRDNGNIPANRTPGKGSTVSEAESQGQPLPPFRVPGFEILGEIGRGGMGIVYRARQLRLDRVVAIKRLLPEFAHDPERLGRFQTEAKAAAKLAEHGILQVFDVLDANGVPALVMPYIEGCDLSRILGDRQAVQKGESAEGRHPWASLSDRAYLDRVLPILDKLLDALTKLHATEILHRDVKPSNILIDRHDHSWLTDFGLARVGTKAVLTSTGQSLGTPGYMSPEQWQGREDLDARADIFSVGVTLYQALTLELPYGKSWLSPQAPVAPPIGKRQPSLSADFDAVILKALEPDRKNRYASALELQQDWRRVRQELPPRARRLGPIRRTLREARRYPWAAASSVLVVLLLSALAAVLFRPAPPPATAAPVRTVRLTTEPPGARIALVPIDKYGELQPDRRIRPPQEQVSPLTLPVPPGAYLVVAEIPGYGFHEVYRIVPGSGQTSYPGGKYWDEGEEAQGTIDNDTFEVPPILILPSAEVEKGMAFLSGGTFTMGDDRFAGVTRPAHQREVVPFFLDTTKVTVSAYREKLVDMPPELLAKYPYPPPGFDDYPVTFVSFRNASVHAEKVGKRLPTEAEYEFAATRGGKLRFPWGNDDPKEGQWVHGPVRMPAFDQTSTDPPVFGLYSNVGEWTDSLLVPYLVPSNPSPRRSSGESLEFLARYLSARVVRGAPNSVIRSAVPKSERDHSIQLALGPRWRQAESRDSSLPGIGFRCARSAKPRFLD
jgi:serine/threonine protein kinase/formylglycine-generating enzyme required for sulfatase activity